MIQKKCAYHPQQNLVNFCRNKQCLLPMCPACVKIHTAQHIKKNAYGNYDCISDLRNEVQNTLQATLKELISNGNQLKQVYKHKLSEKESIMAKLKQMRVKILEAISKYIDGLEQNILNQVQQIESITEQQAGQIDNNIQKLSQEAAKEIFNLKSEKQIKTIISHIAANMSQYYQHKLNQISIKIAQIKGIQINVQRQFKGNEIIDALNMIDQCYQTTFIEPIKRRTKSKINLNESNASKNSKGSSTQWSHKKVL